jgi:hypothetical protein
MSNSDWCPVHGKQPVEDAIVSTMEGKEERFCLRCFSDWLRANISHLEERPDEDDEGAVSG